MPFPKIFVRNKKWRYVVINIGTPVRFSTPIAATLTVSVQIDKEFDLVHVKMWNKYQLLFAFELIYFVGDQNYKWDT